MDEKTAAQRRREEYEKRFAGMSADEIFGDPEPKRPAPQLESMMPGEDSPSSAPPVDPGLETARAMIDARLERDAAKAAEDHYYAVSSGHRKSRELRYRANDKAADLFGDMLGVNDMRDKVNTVCAYIGGLILGGGAVAWLNKSFLKTNAVVPALIAAAILGFVAVTVKRRFFNASSIGEALKLSWKGAAVSAGLIISAVIFGIVRGG